LPRRLWRGCHGARVKEGFALARAIGPRSIRGCRGGATLIGMLRNPVWPVLSVPACWSCKLIWVSAFCMGWMVLPSAALLLPRRRITLMQNKHATGSQPREAIAASALAGTAAMSGVISLLHLTGAFFMLEVYDRVLPSRSVPALVGLVILPGGPRMSADRCGCFTARSTFFPPLSTTTLTRFEVDLAPRA